MLSGIGSMPILESKESLALNRAHHPQAVDIISVQKALDWREMAESRSAMVYKLADGTCTDRLPPTRPNAG
jgi:hypothetical protein